MSWLYTPSLIHVCDDEFTTFNDMLGNFRYIVKIVIKLCCMILMSISITSVTRRMMLCVNF